MTKPVLIPLPATDFDPTEAGVTWSVLQKRGISVTFATPNGEKAAADQRMLTGIGLGPWAPILRADPRGLDAYQRMAASKEFAAPIRWQDCRSEDFGAIVLPGGHAPGMKTFLESEVLQKLVAAAFSANGLIAAICHGTVLVARSKRPDGKSVLFGYRTTALLRNQEWLAWGLTCLWLGNYYRTYSESVQSEVKRSLENPRDFLRGPFPFKRDTAEQLATGFVVSDRNYISARWPGDAHVFGEEIVRRLG